MVRIIICALALLLTNSAMALTKVTASVDKNPVMVKESLILTVMADDSLSTEAFDTSALQADFIVLGTSVSSQTSMVNLSTSYTTKWTTQLIPRKVGKVVIPAFSVAGQQSAAINLTVVAANESSANRQRDIFITSEISSNDVYVQQLLSLTVKLHFSAELKRGSLSDPELEGANIKQIGKDQESEQILNGKRFRVIERTYAITPEQSGQLTLASPIFSGEVIVQSSRRSNFRSFGQSKPVNVVGDNISLNVRPIPDSFQGQWLPSELLTLHQQWQPEPGDFIVGEPITRTISLTAAGLSEEQLPEIIMQMPAGLKVYPDQPKLHTSTKQARLVSQMVRNFAIVASVPGTFELPPLTIGWWNTINNRFEQTTLPAQSIVILANPDAIASPIPAPLQLSPAPRQINLTAAQTPWLQWLFLALWLLTSIAWIASTLTRRSNKTQATKPAKQGVAQSKQHTRLLAACKNNQGQEVLSLLPAWVNYLNTGATQSLNAPVINNKRALTLINQPELSTELCTEIGAEIKKLEQCFYGKQSQDNAANWQGSRLAALVETFGKKTKQTVAGPAIELNP